MNAPTMVLLLSGGIDSPVAGYLLGRQGIKIAAISGFVNPAGDERHIEKIKRHVEALSRSIREEVSLQIFEQRIALSQFAQCSKPGLTCVLCKRAMLRVAEWLCNEIGGCAIIMGDSLGQVASQTLQNMAVVEEAVSIPIIRPLIGLDKVEIIDIARRIGSFEISNLKSPTCAFVPSRPATKAKLEDVKREEERIDIESIVRCLRESVRQIEVAQFFEVANS